MDDFTIIAAVLAVGSTIYTLWNIYSDHKRKGHHQH